MVGDLCFFLLYLVFLRERGGVEEFSETETRRKDFTILTVTDVNYFERGFS